MSSISLPSRTPWTATTSGTSSFRNRTTVVADWLVLDTELSDICLDNCVRQAKGYCRIQWQQNSATTPDSFQIDTDADTATAVATTGLNTCPLGYVEIPSGSNNGQSGLNPALSPLAFQSVWCGGVLGLSGQTAQSSIVCKSTHLWETQH